MESPEQRGILICIDWELQLRHLFCLQLYASCMHAIMGRKQLLPEEQ